VYSDELQHSMVWLIGQLPYGQVSAVFARIGGLELPSSTVWAVCERQAGRLLEAVEREQSQVGIERVRWYQTQYQAEARKGVSMDGGMVNVRSEGWKELKVGMVSSLVAPQDRHDDPDERLSDDLHYTATLAVLTNFHAHCGDWRCNTACRMPVRSRSRLTAPVGFGASRVIYFPKAPKLSIGIMPHSILKPPLKRAIPLRAKTLRPNAQN
jgi:hypothetical protein